MDFILKTRWLTGFDFWIKVIFCRRSVKFPTVSDQCIVLELMTIIRKLHFLHKFGRSRRVGGGGGGGGRGGVLFTLVQQQVLVHCSYFYDA